MTWVSNPGRQRELFLQIVQKDPGVQPASYSKGTEVSSGGVRTVNWPESDVDHSSSFTAKVKSEWNYRYAPHNEVSINDVSYIRRWPHKIIII